MYTSFSKPRVNDFFDFFFQKNSKKLMHKNNAHVAKKIMIMIFFFNMYTVEINLNTPPPWSTFFADIRGGVFTVLSELSEKS